MKDQAELGGRGTTPFSKIRRPETPERRAAINAIKSGMIVADHLFEVRKARGMTQVDLAERLGVSQGNVSEVERRDDLFLSTLNGYIAALGGQLQVSAVFDDGQVIVIGHDATKPPLDDVLPSRSDSRAATA